eukprot:15440498-Alexandrium_andersonii.AAC.1
MHSGGGPSWALRAPSPRSLCLHPQIGRRVWEGNEGQSARTIILEMLSAMSCAARIGRRSMRNDKCTTAVNAAFS